MLAIGACSQGPESNNKPKAIEIPRQKQELKFQRFEKELFSASSKIDTSKVNVLRDQYGEFFEIWLTRLSGVLSPVQQHASSPIVAANLSQYVSDPYINQVNHSCDSAFNNMKDIEVELSDAFTRYKVIFPERKVPELITYTSPFTSNVIAMDTILGAGLHFYLGENYQYYPTLGLPQYMIRRFNKAFMTSDLLKGWLDSEFANDSSETNCLSQMIYNGKILYLAEILAPEVHDTLLSGYSLKQLNWAEQNEYRIWTFLIENQVLYSNNVKTYIKFINDGNGTSGFPPEAPSKLGVYIGWQIVRSFMKNNPNITPAELMKIQNAQLLLSKSFYKPGQS